MERAAFLQIPCQALQHSLSREIEFFSYFGYILPRPSCIFLLQTRCTAVMSRGFFYDELRSATSANFRTRYRGAQKADLIILLVKTQNRLKIPELIGKFLLAAGLTPRQFVVLFQ